jgi:hypothetical protein
MASVETFEKSISTHKATASASTANQQAENGQYIRFGDDRGV